MGELHTTACILVVVACNQFIDASDSEFLMVKTLKLLTFNSHDRSLKPENEVRDMKEFIFDILKA